MGLNCNLDVGWFMLVFLLSLASSLEDGHEPQAFCQPQTCLIATLNLPSSPEESLAIPSRPKVLCLRTAGQTWEAGLLLRNYVTLSE